MCGAKAPHGRRLPAQGGHCNDGLGNDRTLQRHKRHAFISRNDSKEVVFAHETAVHNPRKSLGRGGRGPTAESDVEEGKVRAQRPCPAQVHPRCKAVNTQGTVTLWTPCTRPGPPRRSQRNYGNGERVGNHQGSVSVREGPTLTAGPGRGDASFRATRGDRVDADHGPASRARKRDGRCWDQQTAGQRGRPGRRDAARGPTIPQGSPEPMTA